MRPHKIVFDRPGVYRIVRSDNAQPRRCSFAAGVWPIIIIAVLMYVLHELLLALAH